MSGNRDQVTCTLNDRQPLVESADSIEHSSIVMQNLGDARVWYSNDFVRAKLPGAVQRSPDLQLWLPRHRRASQSRSRIIQHI